MNAQKRALHHLKASGNLDGFQDRTVAALERKKHIRREGSSWVITKRGEALLAGRLGGNLGDRFTMGRNREGLKAARRGKGGRKKYRETAADRVAGEEDLRKHLEEKDRREGKMLGKILGPHGTAGAVKITKTDGEPFTMSEAEAFEAAGWGVLAAASVAGKAGSGLRGVEELRMDLFQNPDLGPRGVARGLIIMGPVNRAIVDELRRQGYDISPAPKKLREPVKNPSKGKSLKRKLYDLIVKITKKGQAWNGQELARALKVDFSDVDHLLLDLSGAGLIHSPGADLFGSTWAAGIPTPGLFKNPSNFEKQEQKAAKRSKEAAERWYGDPELVNATKILRGYEFPAAFLDAGRIKAIEYESDKFDGEERLYRHDVTKKRRLIISADGSTILVFPPFKITKRGIEG